jgi:hypothetical protein
MSDTQITSLQFALFYRDVIVRPDLEFQELNVKMLNIFNGIPSSVNLPQDLPPEIPMLTLRSENNEYICNIARSRIDLHFQRLNDDDSNEKILSDFNAKVASFSSYILSRRSIVRFGMICRYFHANENCIEVIKEKYFKSNFKGSSDIGLRFNVKERNENWEINDMVEIAASDAVINDKKISGIFIQRDINNTPEVNKTISPDDLKNISVSLSHLLSQKSVEELI